MIPRARARPTECRREDGRKREPCLARHRPRGAPRSCPERLRGPPDAGVHALYGRRGERRGDGEGEQHVADHNRLPRIQQVEAAQGPAARQQPVEEQADHYCGEGERRVHDGECSAPAPERPRREHEPQGNPRGASDGRGDERNLRGEQRDAVDLRVAREEKSESPVQPVR